MEKGNMPLRFVQIGDLHLTESGLENHLDFARIVDELNRRVGSDVDFVYLPGDNADDGTEDQFGLVRRRLDRLSLPWRVIPGDHDFKPRSLDNFYRGLTARALPYAETIGRHRCLFLDVVSNGSGGPDFKLGSSQLAWLIDQLRIAERREEICVIFMHAYPADLSAEAEELSRLIDESNVVLVAMGHTHYNELSNDGRTIYAATRSTGQIEEGPVGFSFAVVDDGVVSWRFKPLESTWPFVMITSPVDRRLALSHRPLENPRYVRAQVWGADPRIIAEFRIDGGKWQPLTAETGGLLTAPLETTQDKFEVEVRVSDQHGASDSDKIEFEKHAARRKFSGSDAGSIGAWPQRHLLGTQLGPNRNGRKW